MEEAQKRTWGVPIVMWQEKSKGVIETITSYVDIARPLFVAIPSSCALRARLSFNTVVPATYSSIESPLSELPFRMTSGPLATGASLHLNKFRFVDGFTSYVVESFPPFLQPSGFLLWITVSNLGISNGNDAMYGCRPFQLSTDTQSAPSYWMPARKVHTDICDYIPGEAPAFYFFGPTERGTVVSDKAVFALGAQYSAAGGRWQVRSDAHRCPHLVVDKTPGGLVCGSV